MKKTLLAFILSAIVISSASAQIQKGHFYLGGSLNYNYDEAGTTTSYGYTSGTDIYTNEHITNFQLSPDFGYFLSDKWAVGVQVGYSRVSGSEINNFVSTESTIPSYYNISKYHSDALGIGVHFRYYYMFNDKIGLFPQFGVTTSNNLNQFSNGTLSIGGNPNIVFFATPHLGINLGFGNLAYNLDYKSKTSSFNLGLNTNIGFGLNYYW